jgi:hypothetical protein
MATKARLHWFWRGLIAVAVGVVANAIYIWATTEGVLVVPFGYAWNWLHPLWSKGTGCRYFSLGLIYLPVLVVVLGIYGLLTRWLGGRLPDGELHCRRCDHILRGLSEPRCPECGEAI